MGQTGYFERPLMVANPGKRNPKADSFYFFGNSKYSVFSFVIWHFIMRGFFLLMPISSCNHVSVWCMQQSSKDRIDGIEHHIGYSDCKCFRWRRRRGWWFFTLCQGPDRSRFWWRTDRDFYGIFIIQ